jgi:hypothetical protein
LLTGPGITSGQIKLVVAAQGRVVLSFSSSYSCQSSSVSSSGGYAISPANEFIRPNGRFYSPIHGNPYHGHGTRWSGRFTAAGVLTGRLNIYDTCTRAFLHAQFRGARARAA